MALSRNATSLINFVLDRCLPPIIREQRWFYRLILKRAIQGDVNAYLDFRQRCWRMTPEELQAFYGSIRSNIDRPTDCNDGSIARVLACVKEHQPQRILEFGCGRGHLASLILDGHQVDYTGVDFNTQKAREVLGDRARLIDGVSLDGLADDERFDLVITTHTLEHVLDLREHMAGLLAHAAKTVLIIVPLQLNLRYTPDLHTRFWRTPGDFFLDAGVKPWMNPQWFVDQGDLCVILDVSQP